MKRFPSASPKRERLAVVVLAVLLVAIGHTVVAGDYDLAWHRIAGGGETASTGGGYELAGTIGQHEAGAMSGGGYTLAGGFWAGGGDTVPPPSCPADLTGDGVVDGADLLLLLSAWGPCPGCSSDLNGDNTVDGADLLILLSAWGKCP